MGNTGPALQPGKPWLKEMGVVALENVDATICLKVDWALVSLSVKWEEQPIPHPHPHPVQS